ncbi:MAG: hypothetical protein SOZ14_02225 [Candidatus Pseudoscilispira sp.]|nr:hypothetical protein [Candidatus Pseudoscilispira sp.]
MKKNLVISHKEQSFQPDFEKNLKKEQLFFENRESDASDGSTGYFPEKGTDF